MPIELIWWPRDFADPRVDALPAGEMSSTGDALVNGVALRTGRRLAPSRPNADRARAWLAEAPALLD